jgi:hypothetical protein
MTGQSNGLVTRRSPAAVRVAGVAATIGLLATLLPAGTGHADSDTFDRGYQRSCGASAQAYSPFADVRPNAHNQAVGCLAFLGVSEGRNTSAGRLYQPRSRMLRDQMASLVARTIDLVPNDVYRLPPASEGARFPDVDGVHEDNIRRLVAAEIVEGREDGTYAPRRPVTRAQMASFVARAIEAVTGTELPRAEDPYDDLDGIVHTENIEKLTAIGVVQGPAPGVYAPQTYITRQEVATMLARGLDYLASQDTFDPRDIDPPPADVRVGIFSTPLTPGQPRNQNIRQAADYLDGTRVAPGERMSLNEAIGPRTRERGFQENGFISDGQTISVVGGGVSQVATTFFNAVWFSGHRIITHQPHSQYFERYPPGREATISWGGPDVVIENNSPHPLHIATSHTERSVTVAVVSRPWSWVDQWIDAPDNPQTGQAFTARYGRTVTYPDGSTAEQSHRHTYQSPS